MHLKLSSGTWITIGSVLPTGILIQALYNGEAPSIIMAYVFTMVCLGLERTENLKPRINDIFPFTVIVLASGIVLSYMDRGWYGAAAYVGITILFCFAYRFVERMAENRSSLLQIRPNESISEQDESASSVEKQVTPGR
jgi:hypothetical protein